MVVTEPFNLPFFQIPDTEYESFSSEKEKVPSPDGSPFFLYFSLHLYIFPTYYTPKKYTKITSNWQVDFYSVPIVE